ncbi:unnamed protein product [Phaeothamnion confervicola]
MHSLCMSGHRLAFVAALFSAISLFPLLTYSGCACNLLHYSFLVDRLPPPPLNCLSQFPTVTRVLLAKIAPADAKMSYQVSEGVVGAERLKLLFVVFNSISSIYFESNPLMPPRIPTGRRSRQYDDFFFHYVVERGITYLCMADEAARRRVPFAFLEDIRRKFVERFGDAAQTALAFSMNEEFAPVLQKQMAYYNDDPASDRVSNVKHQIDEVKSSMVENIEKVLERGEKIELLVDKTDRLNQQAFRFDRASKQLQRHMMLRKIKMYAIFGGIGGVILLAIAMMACGGVSFPNC